jgi:hypothetical protein
MQRSSKPRISANKLGEYLKASPARRSAIIKDQKYPKKYIVTRYSQARSAIIEFFTEGKGDKQVIETKIQELIEKTYNTEFQLKDFQLSVEALQVFTTADLAFNFNSMDLMKCDQNSNKLSIEGVEISVRPEIILRGKIRKNEFIGAIKIHISKTNQLSADTGQYVSTLLLDVLKATYPNEKVNRQFCITLDIFSGQYFVAPSSFKSVRANIEAACAEIKARWPEM